MRREYREAQNCIVSAATRKNENRMKVVENIGYIDKKLKGRKK